LRLFETQNAAMADAKSLAGKELFLPSRNSLRKAQKSKIVPRTPRLPGERGVVDLVNKPERRFPMRSLSVTRRREGRAPRGVMEARLSKIIGVAAVNVRTV
jgi:hypothetical protein